MSNGLEGSGWQGMVSSPEHCGSSTPVSEESMSISDEGCAGLDADARAGALKVGGGSSASRLSLCSSEGGTVHSWRFERQSKQRYETSHVHSCT